VVHRDQEISWMSQRRREAAAHRQGLSPLLLLLACLTACGGAFRPVRSGKARHKLVQYHAQREGDGEAIWARSSRRDLLSKGVKGALAAPLISSVVGAWGVGAEEKKGELDLDGKGGWKPCGTDFGCRAEDCKA
jgi:hypothetical protein